MQIPEEFDYLIGCFWNGSLERAKNIDAWISGAVGLLDARKRAIVKPFLDDILSRNLSDQELQRLWKGGGASYGFGDANELRRFLAMIRDKLAADGGR